MARWGLGRQDLVGLVIALLVLAALDLAVIFTNSEVAVGALFVTVGWLSGFGVAALVGRLAGSKRRARLTLVTLAVVGVVAYYFALPLALPLEGMGDGDWLRTLFFGLLFGFGSGVGSVFRRQPSPEEIREQREQRRKSRPVVLAIFGLVVLLTAAVVVDAFV